MAASSPLHNLMERYKSEENSAPTEFIKINSVF